MISVGIITISDRSYKGERKDESGPYIKAQVEAMGWNVNEYRIIPDEQEMIKNLLLEYVDKNIDLILTTGGTGPSERDVTPEATKKVIEKEIPGICDIVRIKTFETTPHSVLSRGIAGIKNKSLIINMPGSLKAVKEYMEIIILFIPHAIKTIKGERSFH